MFLRSLKLPLHRSFFLFGPRGTGKTTLLKTVLPSSSTEYLDLLDLELETRLLRNPGEFDQIMKALPPHITHIVIDEIQKIPALLNEVHRNIEASKKRFFVLTGSSARKLKRGQANLLAGRAFSYNLYPLTVSELGKDFNLDKALQFGTLPEAVTLADENDKIKYLKTYAQTYLKEEIFAEGLVRNLPTFRNFLPLAATQNGQIISWSSFAQDVGVDAKTIRSYFTILEDTLIGTILPAYVKSLRKQQRTHPKFYFFDTGVKRALAGELSLPLVPSTTEYGRAFEHFIITEMIRAADYEEKDFKFSYFATQNTEVDLVIERPGKPTIFAEIKSSDHIKEKLYPLNLLVQDQKNAVGICVCKEKRKRKIGSILICPWQEAWAEICGS